MDAKIALRKTSLVDYPGKVAAVFFFPGCNLRCPWCHNRELLEAPGSGEELVTLEEAREHLVKRRSVLGGVVLSGGEPTLYRDLPSLIRFIKGLGLSVKLDTNGMAAAFLEELFKRRETRPDYIALDLKLAPPRYGTLTGGSGLKDPGGELEKSAALIRASGIDREFRTLVFPRGFITGGDIRALAPLVDDSPWYFRSFMPGNCLDPAWDGFNSPAAGEVEALADTARSLGKNPVIPR
ncbi:MAG: anaerobic ribonucleoside-triphosphate reductase activating protein [Spirochaetaceae bacterium]|jgi:pyruvate formate lyase activating enzyme|nr:anaerobic ribonucleoside-triphosphate reductase activating protein [Spirochaetaceae bacterium]